MAVPVRLVFCHLQHVPAQISPLFVGAEEARLLFVSAALLFIVSVQISRVRIVSWERALPVLSYSFLLIPSMVCGYLGTCTYTVCRWLFLWDYVRVSVNNYIFVLFPH